jgi:hypothetical protein
MRACLETTGYPSHAKPQQQYHMLYTFSWNDDADILIVSTFGAPVEQWHEAALVHAVIKDFKLIDPDRAQSNVAAKRPPASAPLRNEVPTAPKPDPALQAVAKLNTVQFITPMPELPKRMGSDVEPLMNFLQNLTTATARYLQPLKGKPSVANITIGFAPGGRLRVWLVHWDEVLSAAQQNELTAQLEDLTPVQVANRPVALNATLELFGASASKVDPAKLALPDEWKQALANGKGPVAIPDGLPDTIWNRPAKSPGPAASPTTR